MSIVIEQCTKQVSGRKASNHSNLHHHQKDLAGQGAIVHGYLIGHFYLNLLRHAENYAKHCPSAQESVDDVMPVFCALHCVAVLAHVIQRNRNKCTELIIMMHVSTNILVTHAAYLIH